MSELLTRAERALKSGRLPAAPLIALIREVNPTGLELDAKSQRRRYALKSRLQSLLLRLYPDDVEVQPVDPARGLVGLRHRPSGADACHTVVDELDVDVRSRVRFLLDTGSPPAAPAPSPLSRSRPAQRDTSLLAQGRRALAEYDFEEARNAFSAALDDGLDGAAEHLLELLVDHLAAYDDALGLEPRLSAKERSGRVRALLATAAARCGRATDCLRLAEGLEDASLASAFAELARAALASGELPRAAELIARARDLDPLLPELVALSASLEQARAAARAPLEAELERLVAAGDDAATAAHARALLERFPDSATARRTLREVESRALRSRSQKLAADAAAAAAAGDDERALDLYRAALEHGATGLEAAIASSRARLEEKRAQVQISQVLERLRASFDAESCGAWLDLERPAREAVKAQLQEVALDWLEALMRSSHRRELPERIEAVRALKAAQRATPLDSETRTALRRHEVALGALEPGRRALEALRAEERQADLARQQERLEAARASLEAGRWSEVLAQLEGLDAGAELAARARRELDAEQRRTDFEAALEQGDGLRALAVLRAQERESGGAAGSAWQRRLQPLLREAFSHETGEVSDAPEVPETLCFDGAGRWVDLAHRRWYWATAHGRHVFVRRCDLDTGRVLSVCALKTPTQLGSHPRLVVNDGQLALAGGTGALLVLDTQTWDIVDWREPTAMAKDEVFEELLAVPGARYAWLSARPLRSGAEVARVIDLERDRVHRELPQDGTMELLAAPGEPRVAISGFERPGRIFQLSGHLEATLPQELMEPTLSPAGTGYVGIDRRADDDDEADEEQDRSLRVWLWEPGAPPIRCVEVEEAHLDMARGYATSRVHARFYLLCRTQPDEPFLLVAFSQGQRTLKREWAVRVSSGASLIGDLRSERVWLVTESERGPVCVELGEAAPSVGEAAPPRRRLPGLGSDGLWCWPSRGLDATRAAREVSDAPTAAARRKLLERLVAAASEAGAWDVADLAVTLGRWRHPEDAQLALELAQARFPGHGALSLARAELQLQRGALESLQSVLASARAASHGFTPEAQAHLLHLEGIAAYAQEDFEGALAAFEEADSVEGCACVELAGWIMLLRASLNEGAVAGLEGEIVAAVRGANAALIAGDADAELRALDRRAVWVALEDQLAARLATAAVAANDLHPVRRRLILATALARLSSKDARQLPLGELALDAIELQAALAMARDALGER